MLLRGGSSQEGGGVPGRNKGGEHLLFACFMLNAEERFSWQFAVLQTSIEVAYDFYHQWSGVLWQILLDYCCAILSASGDGASCGREGVPRPFRPILDLSLILPNTVSGQTYFPAKFQYCLLKYVGNV